MTVNDGMVDRRTVLGSIGGATLAAFAGCAGSGDEGGADGGEEQDANGSSDPEPAHDLPTRGLVYGFTDNSIVAVDPSTREVVEIEQISGATWGDIFVGPEHLYAIDSRIDQVHIVDLDSAAVASTVDVSGGPGHGFYDETTGRAYVHADDEATLYGIDGANPTSVATTIELTESGHGKVAPIGDGQIFFSNVSDGGVFDVDLEGETVEHFHLDGGDHDHHTGSSLGDGVRRLHGDGSGTHYIQYAPESDLVFVERLDSGHEHSHDDDSGVERLHDDDHDDHDHSGGETVVFDASADEVVGRLDIAGALYASSDGELLAIVDGDDVHLIDATTHDAEVVATVHADGSLGVVRFTDDHVLTVGQESGEVTFVDRNSFEVVDQIAVSDSLSDQGPVGDGRLVTVHGETVSAIDLDEQETEFEVEVPGLELVQYVPEDAAVAMDGRY